MLVPLDGSALSETVLDPAVDLASALGARLLLVRATHTPQAAQVYLEQVAQRLALSVPQVTFDVLGGDATTEISRVAREHAVDVIAMATHGRSGLARLAAGSVATRLLQQAEWPMVIVRPAVLKESSSEPDGIKVPALVPPLPWLSG
jgi:nucleotide-binding universal stress UspA family protein